MDAEIIATAGAVSRRGKGRPRITSREQIIETGLALAAADPSSPLSIVAIAKRLGIAPMAIYNYFPNREALLQALSQTLFEEFEARFDPGTAPIDRIEIWARAIRDHFLKFPELLSIIDYHNDFSSDAWTRKSEAIFLSLKEMGLDPGGINKTARWIWNIVMGAITVEIREQGTHLERNAQLDRIIGDTSPGAGTGESDALCEKAHFDDLFSFHMSMLRKSLAE